MTVTQIPTLDFTDEQLNVGDTSEFVTKMNSFLTELQAWSEAVNQSRIDIDVELDEMEQNIRAEMAKGLPNTFPNSGAFLSADSPPHPTGGRFEDTNLFTGDVDLGAYFNSYNGTIIEDAQEVGRFYYNSSTYGGTLPAISGSAVDFFTAMDAYFSIDPTHHRWVSGWAVAEITSGTGTNGGNFNYDTSNHVIFNLPNVLRAGVNGSASMGFWFRPVDADAYIKVPSQTVQDTGSHSVIIDGVKVAGGTGIGGSDFHRLTQGTVYHIAGYLNVPDEALNQWMLPISAPPATRHQIALPRVIAGAFQVLPTFQHTKNI